MKTWHGNGRAPQPYPGIEQDSDMWIDDGDCHVFFSDGTADDDLRPVFRLHVQRLESARSMFLSNILRYGQIYQAEDLTPPASTTGMYRAVSPDSLTPSNLEHLTDGINPPSAAELFELFLESPLQSPVPPSSRPLSGQKRKSRGFRNIHELTPPMSAAASDTASSAGGSYEQVEITHEIWFKAPSHLKDPYLRHRHHIAIRNFLAILYGRALVGSGYWEMISDLHSVIDTYYELNDPSQRIDSAKYIQKYLTDRSLDDVRNNLSNALGLLAWCEQPSVQWDAGYVEAFVHCVGMLSQNDFTSAGLKNLSRVSRHNLEVAWTNTQLKVLEAEEKLAAFDFAEMWEVGDTADDNPVRKSFEHFRGFLSNFYTQIYRQWPAAKNKNGQWLTRDIVQRLQEDFGAMYDYFVDRDATWDASEERHTRKWEIVCNKPRSGGFAADIPALPFTDMLVSFDLRCKYAHIPHPYPLLPHSMTPSKEKPAKQALFGGLKKAKAVAARDPKEQFQTSLAFSGATNISKFGVTFEENKLVDALTLYEKSAAPSGVAPLHARLGRWILLYGILQVLSTLSVDTGGLKYKDGVAYFLCPTLAGCPPWRRDGLPPAYAEAAQARSYCWIAPRMWGGVRSGPPVLPPIAGIDGPAEAGGDGDASRNAGSGGGQVGAYLGRPGILKPELPLRSHLQISMGVGANGFGGD